MSAFWIFFLILLVAYIVYFICNIYIDVCKSNKPKEEEEEVFDVSDVVESMSRTKPTTIKEENKEEETPQEEDQNLLKETIKDIRLKTDKDLSIEEYYEGLDYDELWLLTFEHLEYLIDGYTPGKDKHKTIES